MFPSLHEAVEDAIHANIFPEPWFNQAGGDHDAIDDYSTHVMGSFECRNPTCSQQGWGSKKIAIQIRRYAGNGYNAVVYKQRCKSCKQLGVLRLDEKSYVDRVSYRLKKWAGIPTTPPEYNGDKGGPAHEHLLCEGCRMGRCNGD
ncbi:uncharacterized protein THITE_2148506 [Thermothielavioides terrestris NRRL 8126]|uniref:3CxxC-type domain-containing protein n=2 Tax=Thermothielavioides terrestris TaxID=2587410 RepID=G2RGV1_THETT|nr:uncharacterized protein THITE_2148506 [Thermothielavioides terrestris NRRL 8126]AEO71936.1 hypothetical protein THITE_2148506 [Thermothielavioides terrestris NRRL 8126]